MRLGLEAALAALLCGPAGGQTAPSVAGKVLVMSDLHFDPMADPRLVDRLVAAEPEQWATVLESSDDKSLSRYGRDANWMLVRSAFRYMKQTIPDPALILISGDFLAHGLRREFDAAAGDHSRAAHRAFVGKTMQFLALQLKQTFPATPIVPALGNNDDECGDYQLQPDGPFLADTLPILHALVGGGGPGMDDSWRHHGNSSVKVAGIRVLSTNTDFLSIHYRNACGSPADPDPGQATLGWLEAELAAASQAQERVWLLYHIPPGIDGYATLRQGMCPGYLIPMWKQAFADRFYTLLRRYSETIAASFVGHTHMDDFRLIGDGDAHYAFALITPAVSPIFGQNPAFRAASYDARGGILDETTYYLTNLAAAAADGNVPPEWQPEYTFSGEWNLPRVDLASLERLYSRIQDEPAVGARWHSIFTVSSRFYWSQLSGGPSDAQAVRAFRCATGNVLPSEYRQCYCGDHG